MTNLKQGHLYINIIYLMMLCSNILPKTSFAAAPKYFQLGSGVEVSRYNNHNDNLS